MPEPVHHACGSITLSLPYPPTAISPNAARGQSRWAAMRKGQEVKAHRKLAQSAMLRAIEESHFSAEFVGYSLDHFTPTIRPKDDDNADGSCKSYRDGIADALGMDDRQLKKVALSSTQKDRDCPRAEIKIWTKAALSESFICRNCGANLNSHQNQ